MPTHQLLEGRDQSFQHRKPGEPAFWKWARRVASANMRGVQLSGAKVFDLKTAEGYLHGLILFFSQGKAGENNP